jgi:iron-sulfur cluster assembly protein
MSILLTEKAAGEVKRLITENSLPASETWLRVGVKGGGCSGFSYMLDLVQEKDAENDEELVCNDVKIVVDQKSLLYLNGTEIDFKNQGMTSGFVFKNPNATSTCGCGSSFQA